MWSPGWHPMVGLQMYLVHVACFHRLLMQITHISGIRFHCIPKLLAKLLTFYLQILLNRMTIWRIGCFFFLLFISVAKRNIMQTTFEKGSPFKNYDEVRDTMEKFCSQPSQWLPIGPRDDWRLEQAPCGKPWRSSGVNQTFQCCHLPSPKKGTCPVVIKQPDQVAATTLQILLQTSLMW